MSFFGFYSDTYGNLSEFHPFKNGSADSSGVRTVSKGTSGGGNRVRGGATHRVYPPHLKMNKCPSEKFIFQPSIFMGDCTQNGHFLVPLDVVDVLLKNAMMVTMDFYGKWKGNFTSYIWMLWEKHSTQSFFFSPWYWMQGTTWGNGLGTTIQDVFGGHGGWSKDHSAWSEVGFSLFFVRVFKVSIFFLRVFFSKGWDEVGDGVACNKAYIYLFGSR